MKIIISPAKKMTVNGDLLSVQGMPHFMAEAKTLKGILQELTYDELKKVWKCNDKIARMNYERVQTMSLDRNLTPAILAFEGIQYQYMAPAVFEQTAFDYLEEHLFILSGFYGALKPFDGIVPYRLEMQARFQGKPYNLYDFWGRKIADYVCEKTDTVVNLASFEYSKCVSCYLPADRSFINVVFGELVDGKVKEKGTYAKMARGEMVRFMADEKIEDVEDMKRFEVLGYHYADNFSQPDRMVFIK